LQRPARFFSFSDTASACVSSAILRRETSGSDIRCKRKRVRCDPHAAPITRTTMRRWHAHVRAVAASAKAISHNLGISIRENTKEA
jgi:hypothetical protein